MHRARSGGHASRAATRSIWPPPAIAAIRKRSSQAGAVDFDDLLLCTEELFARFADVRAAEAGRFDHLLVDEYQDTNGSQYRIVKALAAGHRNLCVVGDDDQSIYGWRGAEVAHILRFKHDWPEAKVVRLEENYRSTAAILDTGQPADRAQQAPARQGAAGRAGRRRKTAHPAMPGRRGRGQNGRGRHRLARGRRGRAAATSPSCFAPTSSRGPSKSSCARRSCPTCSSAACRFTIARKSATSWPI